MRLCGPHNLWAPAVSIHGGKGGRGVNLTILLHLVPRVRVTEAIALLPHTLTWRGRRPRLLLDPDRLWVPPTMGTADCWPGVKAAGTRS